jgi:hypothetical protein
MICHQWYQLQSISRCWTVDLLLCDLLQVHFSMLDLELHSRFTPGQGESVFERDAKIAAKTQVCFVCAVDARLLPRQCTAYIPWRPAYGLLLPNALRLKQLDARTGVPTTGHAALP